MAFTGMEVFQIFSDFNIILKLFVLIMIMNFVINHLGKGPMSWIVMAIVSYFVIFDSWKLFGPVYILYMVLALGFVGFFIDFFFMTTPLQAKKQQHYSEQENSSPSQDAQHRSQIMGHGHRPGGHQPRAPPPMAG